MDAPTHNDITRSHKVFVPSSIYLSYVWPIQRKSKRMRRECSSISAIRACVGFILCPSLLVHYLLALSAPLVRGRRRIPPTAAGAGLAPASPTSSAALAAPALARSPQPLPARSRRRPRLLSRRGAQPGDRKRPLPPPAPAHRLECYGVQFDRCAVLVPYRHPHIPRHVKPRSQVRTGQCPNALPRRLIRAPWLPPGIGFILGLPRGIGCFALPAGDGIAGRHLH
jgi:hypothetical protein